MAFRDFVKKHGDPYYEPAIVGFMKIVLEKCFENAMNSDES